MANITVYVTDELAEQLRNAGISVSPLAQQAFRQALGQRATALKHPLTPTPAGWTVCLSRDDPWYMPIAAWDAEGAPLFCTNHRLVRVDDYVERHMKGKRWSVIGP